MTATKHDDSTWAVEGNASGNIRLRAMTHVVREQIIEINLADMAMERDVDTVKVVLTGQNYGRPRSITFRREMFI